MSAKPVASEEAQIIQVPNALPAKLGPGKGIDDALVERADQAIEQQAGSFLERLVEEVQHLVRLTTELEDAPDQAALSAAQQKIYAANHEMRGEAGTYGFALVTGIANALCRYVEGLPTGTLAVPAVVRAHTDALRAVIRDSVSGDGGAAGKELLQGLQLLAEKMQNR